MVETALASDYSNLGHLDRYRNCFHPTVLFHLLSVPTSCQIRRLTLRSNHMELSLGFGHTARALAGYKVPGRAPQLAVALTAIGGVIIWLRFDLGMGKGFSFERLTRFVIGNFSEGIGMYLLIGLTGYAFSYYRRYRQGELRALRLEAQLSQAQLQALKMQLHPHFLFNTLHSISALLNKQPEAARTMITRLGDFLRLTLENAGTQEVTLQREMEFLRCYLEIERVRFQDRLTTRMDVSPPALDAKVPNLILQPIVENAIRHGIASRSTPGLIEILAKPHKGTLRIQIRDNGPGLPADRTPEKMFTKGLGLANTERRLDRLYGAAHRFELVNDPEGGLVVTLEIPFNTNGSTSNATS